MGNGWPNRGFSLSSAWSQEEWKLEILQGQSVPWHHSSLGLGGGESPGPLKKYPLGYLARQEAEIMNQYWLLAMSYRVLSRQSNIQTLIHRAISSDPMGKSLHPMTLTFLKGLSAMRQTSFDRFVKD